MRIQLLAAVWLTGAMVLASAVGIAHYSLNTQADQRVRNLVEAVHVFVDHSPDGEVDPIIHGFLSRQIPNHNEVIAGRLHDGTLIRMDRVGAPLSDEQVIELATNQNDSHAFAGSQIQVEDATGNSAAVLVVVDKQAQIAQNRRNLGLLALVTAVICALITGFTSLVPQERHQSSRNHSK